MLLGRIGEKYRQAMAQRDGHDEFGGHDAGADGAQPGAETLPDRRRGAERKGLQESLGNDAELDDLMSGIQNGAAAQ